MSQRLLGGVDQATLRQSLSRHGNEATVYLQDSELWRTGDTLRRLESLQLDIVSTDVQVSVCVCVCVCVGEERRRGRRVR